MKELIGGEVYFAGITETVTLSKREMENAPVTFANKGARIMRLESGDLITFGGTNIACVKPTYKEIEDTVTEPEEKVYEEEPLPKSMQEQAASVPKTSEELMAELTEKSNCKHATQELYIQHTAKGIRYFPICSFCGKRERYVSESKINKGEYVGTANEKWTDADIANAKPYIEK